MDLFNQLVQQCAEVLQPKYTVLHFDLTNVDQYEHLIKTAPTDHIAIFCHDHWGDDEELFLPLLNRPPPLSDLFKMLVGQMSNTKFLLCSTSLNQAQQFKNLPNIRVIYIGDEMILNPEAFYPGTIPQDDKNFNSQQHWINLNHNPRIYRNILGCYLLGTNLTTSGILRLDPSRLLENSNWHAFTEYCKYNNNLEIFKISDKFSIMEKGFEKLRNQQEYVKVTHRKLLGTNICPDNFHYCLRNFYRDSFVEIVSDTVFIRSSGLLTEKFIHSVYGFNFPIVMNIAGTVEHLRSIGFDMFDDVINHRYDLIKDPFKRLVTAIDDNYEILSDSSLAKRKWIKCQARLNNNYLLAESLYTTAIDYAIEKINYTLSVPWTS